MIDGMMVSGALAQTAMTGMNPATQRNPSAEDEATKNAQGLRPAEEESTRAAPAPGKGTVVDISA